MTTRERLHRLVDDLSEDQAAEALALLESQLAQEAEPAALPEFFGMVAQTAFEGPLQIHYEYPLGGANNGARTLTMPTVAVLAAMKRDLERVRGMLAKADL